MTIFDNDRVISSFLVRATRIEGEASSRSPALLPAGRGISS